MKAEGGKLNWMCCWLEGILDPYWEQGMEGSFLHALSIPELAGPFLLEEGDLLDILRPCGELLWSGTFQLRKRRFWERHSLGSGVGGSSTLKGLSYATWMEWQWSQPRLKARVLRKNGDEQIVYAWTGKNRERPLRLRDSGVERCLGRKVLQWSGQLGSYGMGGPGFFGLQLEESYGAPCEWMALTLWGARDWLLVNDRWFSAHPKYYEQQRPLYSNFGGEQNWDEVSELLEGAVVKALECEPAGFSLVLSGESGETLIRLPADTSLLPLFAGTDEPRVWNTEEDIRDAWVFTDQDLYC